MAYSESGKEAPASKEYPGIYFFYGSLMDPTRLSDVLTYLDTDPKLSPATLTGYQPMLWGIFPALLPNLEDTVHGCVYDIHSEYEARKLQQYEGDDYAPRTCRCQLANGDWVDGYTFAWLGDIGMKLNSKIGGSYHNNNIQAS